MSQILDDQNYVDPKENKPPEPNKLVGIMGFVTFIIMFIFQITRRGTSETALVQGSYFWMPFLVLGLLGFILPPKNAVIGAFLMIPLTFLFYQIIWPAL